MLKLYTTHCLMCQLVEEKLKEKNIPYEEITDESIMEEKGFTYVPVLETEDGKCMQDVSEIIGFLGE